MAKIMVTCDSTADLDQLFKERNVPFLPLHVLLGEDEGEDGVDIFPADIFEYFGKTKKTPKTAAVTQETYYEFFKSYVAQGYEVIHFTISAEMSVCYENAERAAKECGGVYVVDSRNLSTGIGLSVLYAQDLAAEGFTAAEVVDKVKSRLDKVQASFVVDTMTFLHKGGRCSGVVALVASMLKLKPCIVVSSGEMSVGKKYKGKISHVIDLYVKDLLEKHPEIDEKYVFVTHSYAEDEAVADAVRIVKTAYPKANIITTHAGATVTSHCGKGTLGVLFFFK